MKFRKGVEGIFIEIMVKFASLADNDHTISIDSGQSLTIVIHQNLK